LGIVGLVVQMVGLLRWVFVVPLLAGAYVDPSTDEATRQAVSITFQTVHAAGGVLLGEHVGQAFTVGWMSLVAVEILRTGALPRWLGILGLVASAVYALAQTELLATVVPGVPVIGAAGLVGSLLWLLFLASLGVVLCLPARQQTYADRDADDRERKG
jgi:hypothetical protein